MIDEEKTFEMFGYVSDKLSYGSSRKVVAVCDGCKKERVLKFQAYKCLCRSCSHMGKNNPMFGKHHTKDTKEKISKANMGKKCLKETKLKISKANFGKHHTEETIFKISKSHLSKKLSKEHKQKLSKAKSGKNNSNYGKFGKDSVKWNPNITDEERQDTRKYFEYTEWRKEVYKRDNYTCQICGDNSGGNLNAHHLEGYAKNKKLRTIVLNGITLCEFCHKEFHNRYGYNNTKEQFIEFTGEII